VGYYVWMGGLWSGIPVRIVPELCRVSLSASSLCIVLEVFILFSIEKIHSLQVVIPDEHLMSRMVKRCVSFGHYNSSEVSIHQQPGEIITYTFRNEYGIHRPLYDCGIRCEHRCPVSHSALGLFV
jgi:hypothetical protein